MSHGINFSPKLFSKIYSKQRQDKKINYKISDLVGDNLI